jgi:hypothetical protein
LEPGLFTINNCNLLIDALAKSSGFKKRVYLTMQQYNNVITEANKIVDATTFTASAGSAPAGGVNNALEADVTNVFKAPYATTESVFSVPFITTETQRKRSDL